MSIAECGTPRWEEGVRDAHGVHLVLDVNLGWCVEISDDWGSRAVHGEDFVAAVRDLSHNIVHLRLQELGRDPSYAQDVYEGKIHVDDVPTVHDE